MPAAAAAPANASNMNVAMTPKLNFPGMNGSSILLAAGGLSRVAWAVLVVAAALLSLAWLYLMLSSRGATRPVAKCLVLSVGAHLILLGWASLMQWFPLPDGVSHGQGELRVHWIGDEDALVDDERSRGDSLNPAPAMGNAVDCGEEEAPAVESTANRVQPLFEGGTASAPQLDEPQGASAQSALDPPRSATPAEEIAQEPSVDEDSRAASPIAPSPDDRDADAEHLFTSTQPDEATFAAQPETVASLSEAGDVRAAELPMDPPLAADVERLPGELTPVAARSAQRALPVAQRYAGRTADHRRQLAAARGGSESTEAAVEAGLAWLARAQNPQDGRWDNRVWEGGIETRDLGGVTYGVQADTAVTGLALLAFLGAGHTHQQGPYQETVRRGLQFLVHCQSRQTGSLAGDASHYVAMYCHGIATLALSEALIMTQDGQLHAPLVRAVDYTVRSQHPVTGGWRYQPGDLGDTSQFGWQVMALVSAEAAGIPIPDRTWKGTRRWFDRVALGRFGGLACYTPDRPVPSPSMTAEALFCRAFMRDTPGRGTIEEAADYVAQFGTQRDALHDLYYCYYASLALYQLHDHRWERWNRSITEHLVHVQRQHGPLAGSWDCDTRWGRVGGRVYTTSMACLCLETYYRYLPVVEIAAARGRAIGLR